MQTAKIGRPHPAWTSDLGEGALFEWQGPVPTFIVSLDLERGDERRFKKAAVRLGLLRRGPALMMVAEWKDWLSLDAPFHAAMAKARGLPQDAHPVLPEGKAPADGLRLDLHLVDAETGRFTVERPVRLSPRFTDILVRNAREQMAKGLDEAAYYQALEALQEEYDDPDAMLRAALVVDKPAPAGDVRP